MTNKPYRPTKPSLIGNIKRLLVLPCDVKPSIWADLGIAALCQAVWTAENPDVRALISEVTGSSLLCHTKHVMHSAHGAAPLGDTPASTVYFKGLETADLATWYFFLAGVAKDGLFDWTSQVLRVTKCNMKDYPGQGHGTFWFGAIYADGRWGTLSFQFPANTDFHPAHVSAVDVPAGGSGIVAFSAAFQTLNGIDADASARIVDDDDGTVLAQSNVQGGKSIPARHARTFIHYRNNTQRTKRIVQEWSCNLPGAPANEVFPIADETEGFMGYYR
jgi:hypothetical protein